MTLNAETRAPASELIGELNGFEVVGVTPISNLQDKQIERGAGRGFDAKRSTRISLGGFGALSMARASGLEEFFPKLTRRNLV